VSRLRGRFSGEVDADFQRFSSSARVDLEIAAEDLEASIAHATMLGEQGIVSADDADALVGGLERIADDLAHGRWSPSEEYDDVHMAVEARLTELIGSVAGRLHTARSRNDQVATDVPLWLRRRLDELEAAARKLVGELLDRVESDGDVLMPGYTHLQRGQPILLGHHLLAHAWSVTRDAQRFADARARADRCPLGAGAMAGTPHPVDRERTAELLGFSGPVDNAMDAVAARDHLQETVAACAIAMGHLSRMAAELVLWSSSEFQLVRVDESHATGSSIMPNKRNPDGAELVRGKAGRVFGDLQALLTLTKGLPLAYNRDLQEDREPLLDAVAQTLACLRLTASMWARLTVRRERFEDELVADWSLATELADLLVDRGLPFREAHETVGRLIRWCEERGGGLELADGGGASSVHPLFPEDLGPWLDPRAAVERRTSRGGTASGEVVRQVEQLRSWLGAG
jgi:argininosuccinate lyase